VLAEAHDLENVPVSLGEQHLRMNLFAVYKAKGRAMKMLLEVQRVEQGEEP
jgi:hypothetical protein